MSTQRYSVTPHEIQTLLSWVKSGEIAIPEIQRPFVWDATRVRNLLDSLYQGYPVGYLITWRNPNVKLKDGSTSLGKRVLIDGQQRVTALMASLLGREVLTKNYDTMQIRIAFHPSDEKFEVANPAIRKDPSWIPDVAAVFKPDASVFELVDDYCEKNPSADKKKVSRVLERLRRMVNNSVGVIELADDLDIQTVTEIFIRVNASGAELSQADFAMSKIAVNETYGGNLLRKAIDYFCHLAVAPEFLSTLEKDKAFANSEFMQQMCWLEKVNDDLYDPTYTDMLRVAFTSEFGRGRLQDLVALLSGRNFDTKQHEEVIAEQSFAKLKKGVLSFMRQTHFERLTMALRSAGFVTSSLFGGHNAVNFAYVVYLKGREQELPAAEIERLVTRWYSMSILRGRYGGNPEGDFDFDIRQIESKGVKAYVDSVIEAELPETFWTNVLPQELETSSANSAVFRAYQAAQVKFADKGFLSRDITVRDLLLNSTDVHHVYPRNHLKKKGLARGQYNQVANFVLTQTEINIAIGDRGPEEYFEHLADQCAGGKRRYGGIVEKPELVRNYKMNCIPEQMADGEIPAYDEFLASRRRNRPANRGWQA